MSLAALKNLPPQALIMPGIGLKAAPEWKQFYGSYFTHGQLGFQNTEIAEAVRSTDNPDLWVVQKRRKIAGVKIDSSGKITGDVNPNGHSITTIETIAQGVPFFQALCLIADFETSQYGLNARRAAEDEAKTNPLHFHNCAYAHWIIFDLQGIPHPTQNFCVVGEGDFSQAQLDLADRWREENELKKQAAQEERKANEARRREDENRIRAEAAERERARAERERAEAERREIESDREAARIALLSGLGLSRAFSFQGIDNGKTMASELADHIFLRNALLAARDTIMNICDQFGGEAVTASSQFNAVAAQQIPQIFEQGISDLDKAEEAFNLPSSRTLTSNLSFNLRVLYVMWLSHIARSEPLLWRVSGVDRKFPVQLETLSSLMEARVAKLPESEKILSQDLTPSIIRAQAWSVIYKTSQQLLADTDALLGAVTTRLQDLDNAVAAAMEAKPLPIAEKPAPAPTKTAVIAPQSETRPHQEEAPGPAEQNSANASLVPPSAPAPATPFDDLTEWPKKDDFPPTPPSVPPAPESAQEELMRAWAAVDAQHAPRIV